MNEMGGPLAFPIELSTAKTLDDLYDWYMRIDGHEIEAFAINALEAVLQENSVTKGKIAAELLKLKKAKD